MKFQNPAKYINMPRAQPRESLSGLEKASAFLIGSGFVGLAGLAIGDEIAAIAGATALLSGAALYAYSRLNQKNQKANHIPVVNYPNRI